MNNMDINGNLPFEFSCHRVSLRHKAKCYLLWCLVTGSSDSCCMQLDTQSCIYTPAMCSLLYNAINNYLVSPWSIISSNPSVFSLVRFRYIKGSLPVARPYGKRHRSAVTGAPQSLALPRFFKLAAGYNHQDF